MTNVLNDVSAIGDRSLLATPDRKCGTSLNRKSRARRWRHVIANFSLNDLAVLSGTKLAADYRDQSARRYSRRRCTVRRVNVRRIIDRRLALLDQLRVALVLVGRGTLFVVDDGALLTLRRLATLLVLRDAVALVGRDAVFHVRRVADLLCLGVTHLRDGWSAAGSL